MTEPKRWPFETWTIYEKPTDFPNDYVARMFVDGKPSPVMFICSTLDDARNAIHDVSGCNYRIARHPTDEPQVVETWI